MCTISSIVFLLTLIEHTMAFFIQGHLILHLELHCLSFVMWGAAVLVEWLSPGHYLYLMLQTVMGYQLKVCA